MNIYYFLMSVKARSKALELDCQIAEAIQELFNNDETLEIKKIAGKAHTSVSTVSRFVRRYGFESFSDFVYYSQYDKSRDELSETVSDRETYLFENNRAHELTHQIKKLNAGKDLNEMFKTLLGSRKVFFVGNPIPQECYFL